MAHKKGQGSVKNGRDSASKRLGVKEFGGTQVTAGSIIIRQRGTLYALTAGKVLFDKDSRRVNIVTAPAAAPAAPAKN